MILKVNNRLWGKSTRSSQEGRLLNKETVECSCFFSIKTLRITFKTKSLLKPVHSKSVKWRRYYNFGMKKSSWGLALTFKLEPLKSSRRHFLPCHVLRGFVFITSQSSRGKLYRSLACLPKLTCYWLERREHS